MHNLQGLRGKLRQNEPLAKHTTWRVGGLSEWFYQPADVLDLAHFLQQLPLNIPVFWMGLGSNLLIRDGGIPGVVIHTAGLLNTLKLLENTNKGTQIYLEAGVSCAKLARFAARQGLSGSEFLAGIPGTLGGALTLNAGAWGQNIWTLVTQVETLNRQGQRQQRTPQDYEIGYRQVHLTPESKTCLGLLENENEWFTAATLQLTTNTAVAENQAKIKALLQKRNETQPIGLPSGGSVFRNPPGDYAGRLIEQAGWKGRHLGGAYVSEKHANFIINQKHATAKDIETLIENIRESIQTKYGINLIPEVHIVGI